MSAELRSEMDDLIRRVERSRGRPPSVVRIDQLVPSFVRHDAISNHVLQLRQVLRDAGFDSEVYVGSIDHRLAGQARLYSECSPAPDRDRVLLYHVSTDSPMAAWLRFSG